MWKDATSYRQGDKERKQTTYKADHGRLSIVVTCGHIHYQNEWIMHCHRLGIENRLLNCENVDEAKRLAVKIVMDEIETLRKDACLLDA